jgi:REP element-mobilizing transposase RayT
MRLNALGEIVRSEWEKSASVRAEIEIREYVVMPNHFHAIVVIHWGGGMGDGRGDRPVARTEEERSVAQARPRGPDPKSIGALIAGFKSAATTRINQTRQTPGMRVWQRNYFEHIIRDEQSYEKIAAYILDNPRQWEEDT